MPNLSSTALPPLLFERSKDFEPQKIMAPTSKIGWLTTQADKPGVSFDLTIKDGLGRIKYQKLGCKTDTKDFGGLVNLPTFVGEPLEVFVENLQGADKLQVFVN
jgi:hypothetical protein